MFIKGENKMKRKWLICLGLVMFLSGCGTTDLHCTKRIVDNDQVKVDQEIKLSFTKKGLKEGSLGLTYYYANNIDENTKQMKEELENQYHDYKDKKGIDYDFTDQKQGFYFEIEVNLEKLSSEDKDNFNILTDYEDYRDASDTLMKDGYSCE